MLHKKQVYDITQIILWRHRRAGSWKLRAGCWTSRERCASRTRPASTSASSPPSSKASWSSWTRSCTGRTTTWWSGTGPARPTKPTGFRFFIYFVLHGVATLAGKTWNLRNFWKKTVFWTKITKKFGKTWNFK